MTSSFDDTTLARRLARAEQLDAAGHHAEVETEARAVLSGDPESVRALRLLAHALVEQDRADEALAPAREACRVAPDDLGPLLTLGHTATRAGRGELAVQAGEHAVALAPHSSAAHYTLGMALVLGASDVTRALTEADEAARLAPSSADVHNLRGICLARCGDRGQARAAYEQALALDPQHALALSNLASIDVRSNPVAAARRLTMAAAMDPQQRIIHRNFRAATHNFVLQLRWFVVVGGMVAAGVAGGGGSLIARSLVVGALGLFVLLATGHFIRQLPHGYRASPLGLLRSVGRGGWTQVAFFGFVALNVVLVAFGSQTVRASASGRLTLLALVGVVTLLVRKARARRRH